MDREKVIKGLENCMAGFDCPQGCPYLDDCNDLMKPMFVELAKDALALLKEQEAITPILVREGQNKYYNYYHCPICDEDLYYEQNYCSECGKAIKWD